MTDLNGSLMFDAPRERRRTRARSSLAVCIAVLGLAACHDSTTSPATATTLTVLSGGSQTGTVGAVLAAPVVLQVKDQNGSAMAGVAVSLTVGTASGTVSATQLTTDANGQVTVNWTLGTVAGTDTLVAQIGSLPVLDVLATATPGAPASLVVVSGDNQTATAGTALPTAMTVKVVDQYGNAVPNATVTFSDDANGTLAATTVNTDASGMASDTITLGANTGTDDVTATIQTASGPVTITMHETAS